MTTRRNLFLLLVAGLSTLATAQSESTVEIEVMNDGMYEEEIGNLRHGQRELYSFGTFSFSSLLFSLHMCDVDPTCPEKVHRPPINPYCPGCPDCKKLNGPKAEHWLKGWCSKNSDSSASDSDGGEVEQSESDNSNADVATNGAGGSPSAARTMNWLIFAAAAGVAVTALVAAAMRKRQEEEGDGMKATDPNHQLTGSIAKRLMGGMGLSTGADETSTIVTEENTLGTNFIAMDHVSDAPAPETTDAPAEQGIEIDEGEPIVPGSRYDF